MKYKLIAKDYKEALKNNRLLGVRCSSCSTLIMPPKKVCPTCGSEDLYVYEFSGIGKVQTFTVIHGAPEGYETPYIVGLIELDEGPWMMGNIVGVDPNKATMELMGKRVRAGHKITPPDLFSAGERIAASFSLES